VDCLATCHYLLRQALTPNACCRIEATSLGVNHCKLNFRRIGVEMAQSNESAVPDVTQGQPPAGPRNRPRASHACQRCRAKKAKCDQSQPCSNCVRYSSACVFTPGNRGGSRRNTSTRDKSFNQDQHARHSDPTQASQLSDVPVGASRAAALPQDKDTSRPSMSVLSEPDPVGDRASPPRDHASCQSGNLDPTVSTKPPTVLNYVCRLHPADDPRQRL
jgi:hypothetical protein